LRRLARLIQCSSLLSQLTESSPTFAIYIADRVKGNSSIGQKTLERQWKCLILHPPSNLDNRLLFPPVLVLVINALEECVSDQDVRSILRLINEVCNLTNIPSSSSHYQQARDIYSSWFQWASWCRTYEPRPPACSTGWGSAWPFYSPKAYSRKNRERNLLGKLARRRKNRNTSKSESPIHLRRDRM